MNTQNEILSMKTQQNRIIYIEESFCVVLKTPGEICESDSKNPDADLLTEVIRQEVIERLNHEPECIQCVHRLDRCVSGVVVVALTRSMFTKLSNVFQFQQSLEKTYWAVVEGIWDTLSTKEYTRLEHYHCFDTKKQKAYVVPLKDADGTASHPSSKKWKKAFLDVRLVGKGEKYSFVEVKLLTGRTHQIRVQLSSAGYPIKGDVKYRARRKDSIPGIRLHARSIAFKHPDTNKEMFFEAPLFCEDSLWKAFVDCHSAL